MTGKINEEFNRFPIKYPQCIRTRESIRKQRKKPQNAVLSILAAPTVQITS